MNELDDLLGDIPITPKREESIDDLLGAEPLHVPKGKALSVPLVTGPLVAFRTRLKGELIIAPGTKYFVVNDSKGKLHYKEASACKILPEDWKPEDGLPPLD
jgi:hypothetical protein